METNNEIFNQIVDLTGLPKEKIAQELRKVLQSCGFDPATVSLDQLREALSEYLQNILLEIKSQN